MREFEIYYDNLTEGAKTKICDVLQTTPDEENWDFFPLCVICRKGKKDEDSLSYEVKSAINDLKRLYGMPPYNDPSNILCGDGYFHKSLKSKYSKTVLEEAERRIRQEEKG